MSFFAIMNPIANTPFFMSVVKDFDDKEQKRIALRACILAFIVTFAFIIFGPKIFESIGITIPAFKITGGALLFYVGFKMLMSTQSEVSTSSSKEDRASTADALAVTPLAIPMLAGPGTLVAAMNAVTDGSLQHIVITTGVLIFILVLSYFTFSGGRWLMRKIHKSIMTIISKIMGLILAIMGMGMIGAGIKLMFNLPM